MSLNLDRHLVETDIPKVSVAPMMQRTDRHFRYLIRLLSKRTLLYTEMVTAGAILHGDVAFHLGYSEPEHPIALQLGGDDPEQLARCAQVAQEFGYDEINLNVGCPSDRVQRGSFGAVLMLRPHRVRACVQAMHDATDLPITVKHRIGVDEVDSYEDLLRFVETVSQAPCIRFSVHARKAWLSGLSPKQNRTVPPLRYDDVYRLKADHPDLCVEINGGITTMAQIKTHLEYVDAVMIGRAAYDNPMLFAAVDAEIFATTTKSIDELEAARAMLPYAESWIKNGGRLHHISRHMLALFQGQPGARAWRRTLTEASTDPKGGVDPLLRALDGISNTQARREFFEENGVAGIN
jgi:tRNA-dihydrouridine synthase A